MLFEVCCIFTMKSFEWMCVLMLQMGQTDIWLRHLPSPRPAHLTVLGHVLDSVLMHSMCPQQELQRCRDAVLWLQKFLREHIPGQYQVSAKEA